MQLNTQFMNDKSQIQQNDSYVPINSEIDAQSVLVSKDLRTPSPTKF